MVEILPFKGILYNKKKIAKLDEIMAPPYDIISEEMQTSLYNKHPNNFVRLTLNTINSKDNEKNNRYTRSKELFERWLDQSILIKSEKTAVYPYKISYKVKNKEKTMSGFFVLLKLDPEYKMVKAHERTLSKPKADRLNLMRACKTNFEPIQLLYIDAKDEIRTIIDKSINEPLIKVKGYDGFIHKLWKIEDKKIIDIIKNKLKNEILFIADGHHRYQTAIDFSKEMRTKTGNTNENASFNYRMVILVNMFDEGLSILPTHRLIKKSDLDMIKIIEKIKEYFIIEEKNADTTSINPNKLSKKIREEINTKNQHKFAIYRKNKYYILTLKDEKSMNKFANDKSKNWRTLDVSILHKIVLEHFMDINQNNLEDHVEYTRVDQEAIKFVNEGKYDFSIIMNATKIEELKAVADEGEHMPQKSTYFLPKMLSGLVMYKMND